MPACNSTQKKCHFASKSIKVLGHVVSKVGNRPVPDKITAVIFFPDLSARKSCAVSWDWHRTSVVSFATFLQLLHRCRNSSVPILHLTGRTIVRQRLQHSNRPSLLLLYSAILMKTPQQYSIHTPVVMVSGLCSCNALLLLWKK